MPAWLLPGLCMLGCPLMMGVMMITMRRDRDAAKLERQVSRLNHQHTRAQPRLQRAISGARRLWCAMCVNWKVVGFLALVAAVTAIIRPDLLVVIGPLLLVLACPLSMALMLRQRTGPRCDDVN